MLAEGHLSAVIFSLVFTILAAVIYWKISGWAVKNLRSISWKLRPVIAFACDCREPPWGTFKFSTPWY